MDGQRFGFNRGLVRALMGAEDENVSVDVRDRSLNRIVAWSLERVSGGDKEVRHRKAVWVDSGEEGHYAQRRGAIAPIDYGRHGHRNGFAMFLESSRVRQVRVKIGVHNPSDNPLFGNAFRVASRVVEESVGRRQERRVA